MPRISQPVRSEARRKRMSGVLPIAARTSFRISMAHRLFRSSRRVVIGMRLFKEAARIRKPVLCEHLEEAGTAPVSS